MRFQTLLLTSVLALVFSSSLFAQDLALPAGCNLNSKMDYIHNQWPGVSFVSIGFCFSHENSTSASAPFFIGFYLSTDINIDTSDYLIGDYLIGSLQTTFNGPLDYFFPGDFGSYFIDSIDYMPGIPHGVTLYGGAILDYTNNYSETDENNNAFLFPGPGMKIQSPVGREDLLEDTPVNFIYVPGSQRLKLAFESSLDSPAELSFNDLTGKELLTLEIPINAKVFETDLNGLSSGIYLASITVNGKKASYKLVVQ